MSNAIDRLIAEKNLRLVPDHLNFTSASLAKNYDIDFNVFLPTLGINLQRDFVWTDLQKSELILSILLRRHINSISVVFIQDGGSSEPDKLEVIDGKQRISTVLEFIDGKFPVIIYGEPFFYNDLPESLALEVSKRFHWSVNVLFSYPGSVVSDADKVQWFRLLNYAGTAMDYDHMAKLERAVDHV